MYNLALPKKCHLRFLIYIGNLVYRIEIIDRKDFQEKAREQIFTLCIIQNVSFSCCWFQSTQRNVQNCQLYDLQCIFLSLSFTEIISLRLSVQTLYQTLKEL